MADGGMETNSVISFGPFRVIRARRIVERDGEAVHIGSRAFDVLVYLLEHAGQVVSHRALLEAVWPGTYVEEGSLRFQVATLRKALGDVSYIINVPGRGYCFAAPISRLNEAERPQPHSGILISLPRPLPRLGRLFGRDREIADIVGLGRTNRIVSIVAPGGMGKTSVAIAAASELRHEFGNGVCFVELGLIEDPARVRDALAVALGVPVRSADPFAAIVGFLKHRRMLILMDGCEHVIGTSASLLEQVVAETSGVHVLVTSREALRIEYEQVFHLEPLASPPVDKDLPTAAILAYPASQLFMERARAAVGALSPDAEAKFIAEICSKLDGLALAIELVASQVQAFGFDKLSGLLEERLSLTWPGRRTAHPRHQTLNAMLDWSYRLLTEEEKRVLRFLSVFSGPFDLEAASAVGGKDATGVETASILAELASKSLLSVIQSETRTRYRLLDTTKAYARAKLAETHEVDAARRRHAEFFLRALQDPRASEQDENVLKILSRRIEDIRAAVSWAFSPQGETALAVALVIGSIPIWNHLHLFQEEKLWTTRALSLAKREDVGIEIELALQEGLAWASEFTTGLSREFGAAWSRVLELATTVHKTDRQLAALIHLCSFHVRQSNIQEALEYVERFQHLVQPAEESSWTGMVDYLRGCVLHNVPSYSEAREYLGKAAAESRATALAAQYRLAGFDCRWTAMAYLAVNYLMQGDIRKAMETFERALRYSLSEGRDISISVAQSRAIIGWILIGDRESATRVSNELLRRCKEGSLGDFLSVAKTYVSLLDAWRGNENGIRQLDEDIAEVRSQGYRLYTQFFTAERLRLLIERRKQGLCTPELEPLPMTKSNMGSWYLPEVIRVNGRLSASEGRTAEAEQHFNTALESARSQASPFWELRIANDLAQLWVGQGKPDAARSLLEEALGKFSSRQTTEDIALASAILEEL
jgi:predicted ATPase/DNA-binding winged helix-turn-helix (wHTH) protein